MKKLAVLMMMTCILVGCSNTATTEPETEHTHVYAEQITTEATCETEGLKTLTCECGDISTEVIPATGHIYENYVSNEDATYLADGTETAKCNGCDITDTRTAEGSKLEYTYAELDKTMYAKQSVNIRDLPSTDGNKLGGLSFAQEIHVTGQCEETSWYRIEFEDGIAYVSNSFLVDEKPVAQVTAQTNSGAQAATSQQVSPSGLPGDTNGDGVVDTQESIDYIDPQEQLLINAGYGNVVQLDATTYAVITPEYMYNGMLAPQYLYEYLQSIGIGSNDITGCQMNNNCYESIARNCYPIPQ